MMKFFRKYTKHLLVVFMTLLLIIWLGGDAISSLVRGRQEALQGIRGEMFGREVSWQEVGRAGQEAELLSYLGLNWKLAPFIVLADVSDKDSRGEEYREHMGKLPREPLNALDWMMLDAAAQRGKTKVTPQRLEQFKEQSQITPEHIFQVSQRYKVSQKTLNGAIASFVRVIDVAEAAVRAVQPSEADLQQEIRENVEKAKAQFVLLPYKNFIDPDYQPSEQELTEHFDKYKNEDPQPGQPLTFGYRVPSAVQVEYLKVDAQELIDHQRVSEDEAYDYWTQHKQEFQYAVTQPAGEPTPPQPTSKPYDTFTEAKAEVVAKLKTEKAKREALDIAREMIRRLSKPWENAPATQPGGYRQPPESETLSEVYTKLADAMQARYGKAVTYARTNLMEAKDFNEKEPQFATAAQPGAGGQPASTLAFMVSGLEEGNKNENNAHLFRNVYQTADEPLVDQQQGDAYVYRTIAVRPKAPPENIDANREQLVQDIRLTKAAAAAEESAKTLAEDAAQKGLVQALEDHPELKGKLDAGPATTQPTTRPASELVRQPPPFTRPRSYSFGPGQSFKFGSIPGVGNDAELIEKVFQMGAETATQPQKVQTYNEKNQQRWVVVQLDELMPITETEYQQQREAALKSVLAEKRAEVVGTWFDPEQIRARVQWKDAQGVSSETQDDEETSDATADQAQPS